MSIYTITLKRELLGSGGASGEQQQQGGQSSLAATGEANFSGEQDKFGGRREGEVDQQQRQKLSQKGGERKRQAREQAEEKQEEEEEEGRGEARSEPPHRAIDGSNRSRPAPKDSANVSDFEQFCLNDADWLDCICGAQARRLQQQQQEGIDVAELEDKENNNKSRQQQLEAGGQSSSAALSHSSDCLIVRREQLVRLQAKANEIVHSVNVTLEVSADLTNVPNEIVWYKNQRQLTSSERPVFYLRKPTSSGGENNKRQDNNNNNNKSKLESSSGDSERSSGGPRRKSIKRTKSQQKRQSTSAQGYSIEETTTFVEEQILETGEEEARRGDDNEEQLVEKCRQVTSDKGSKLTIFNLQDEDYGQYTCRLIDLEGNQLNIHTQLKQQQQQQQEQTEDTSTATSSAKRSKTKQQPSAKLFSKSTFGNMDEIIEVKEGDFNIELGIQILPEINEDEELMSEEEKAEFIENTTINWFKDDVKLDQNDPEVQRLFQFTYDQNEGFHRLIVRKATKETEGVYTCLVENESGTSSCSTQLVVGPGNKPKLTSRLQDVTVYVGQSLEFRIKSTGLPPIDSCQWFKDDELLVELSSKQTSCKSKSNERISMSRSEERSTEGETILIFKLNIDQLKLDDSGRFKCRINNEYGYDESDCYVKVLQEIIEEHEEIEETIEETLNLGGGKKSTTTEEILEEQEERRDVEEREVKRQKHDDLDEDVEMSAAGDSDGGRAPQFKLKLQDKKVILVEQEERSEQREELIVSTRRDRWSNSRDSLKIQWFLNGQEIKTSTTRRRSSAIFSSDETEIEHEIVNFYDETGEEIFHKLILKRRGGAKVSSGKSSTYSCKASNEFGSSETRTQVSWSKRPKFLRKLEDTETSVGETVVLKVTLEEEQDEQESSGRELRFSRDGKLIYSSKTDGQKREFVTSSGSRIKVRNYEEFVETTTTTTEETTTTRYQRRFSRPSTTKRLGRTYELTIENVQIDQQGQWECQAINESGSAECRADLEVFAEPRLITDLPEAVRLAPGKEIRLHVEASGSPRPVYSWFKDQIGIAEEEDRVFTETRTSTSKTTSTRRRSSVTSLREEDGISISGETLIIRGVRPEDAGQYSCKVENRLGQVESRSCKMTVIGHGDDLKGAPKIIKDFQRDQCFSLDEGESVILKVLAEGQPRPRQYWFKDTEEIVERVSRFEVEQEGQEYKLTIKRSEVSDSGKYKVVLRNEMGETESRTVEVRVNKLSEAERSDAQRRPSAPSILVDSQDKVVGLGSNVSFDVQVAGHPKPLVTWYKNGRRITESGDGRISFVEEETIVTTTITEIEEDQSVDEGKVEQRRETTTTHKLIIRDVCESDEAIYSLKAENDLGSTKSALSSLSVDKRKAAVDELVSTSTETTTVASKRRDDQQQQEVVEEETTTTTTTVTKTRDEREDESEESGRQKSSSKSRRREEVDVDDEDEYESDGEGGKKRKTIRTTRTTTKTTTTTTTAEEEEEEAERRRRQKQVEEEESKSKNKRRTVEEVEEEVEEEEEERIKRRTRTTDEREDVEQVVDEETTKRPKPRTGRPSSAKSTDRMDVDEEDEEIVEEEEDEELDERRRRRDKKTTSQKQRRDSSRRDSVMEEEETIEDELIEEERRRSKRKPRIVSAPKEVIAGLGSSPEIEVEIEEEIITEEEIIEETVTKVTWLKDGQKIDERMLRDKHIELVEQSSSQPNRKKQILRINNLRSSDAGEYKLRVENPAGKAETAPIKVAVDRLMRPGQRPSVTQADIVPPSQQEAPEILSVPEEIVGGMGSKPELVAEVRGKPEPELSWFKDGQPLEDQPEFKSGHVEVIKLPTDQADVVKQALKINDLRPADVAAYHVKAENPAGEVESEPTNVRIDRTMAPSDEPIVTGIDKPSSQETERPKPREPAERRPAPSEQSAPTIVSLPEEVVAGPGSSPQLEAEVAGKPAPQLTWLRDGEPIRDRDLRTGHVEIIDLPTDKPDTVKQALKINDLRATDVAEYSVKAENPLGQVESAPAKVRLDRLMSAHDLPVVKGLEPKVGATPDELAAPEEGAPSKPSMVAEMPKEVIAGPGSSPQLEVEVKGKPQPQLTWLKDGQPISDRDLRIGHVEIVDLPSDTPDTVKQALKINDLRPTDVAAYSVKAENPLGEVESQPTQVRLDRRMSRSDAPKLVEQQPAAVKEAATEPLVDEAAAAAQQQVAPTIVSLPDEIVAGRGAAPAIEAEVAGVPKPELTWLKDGLPISERDLRLGHLEIVDLPGEQPDTVKQALKINDLKPTDVAAYSVRAENPLGQVESQPANVKLDRSMSSLDEPIVSGQDKIKPDRAAQLAAAREEPEEAEEDEVEPLVDQVAPTILSAPEEVVAPRGSSPMFEVDVVGTPKPELSWFKDGQPIDNQDFVSGKIEIVNIPTNQPDTIKQALKINDLKPADVAAYHVKAENIAGEVESEPTNVRIDRTMAPTDQPIILGVDKKPTQDSEEPQRRESPTSDSAPKILSAPEEVVAGRGGSPQIEALVSGTPQPQLTWLKDGQPLSDRDLRTGHLEVVNLPTERPDEVSQALKINDLRPTDVAAYSVKAENPLGAVESKPTSVRIDRSMAPSDEPVVSGVDKKPTQEAEEPQRRPSSTQAAPRIISAPEEIVAGRGSSPQVEALVSGTPQPQLTWLKDGQPISDRDLRTGHVEVVDLPSEKPDEVRQALKINDLKPTDVAAYSVKAENPLGVAESQPTKVKLDRKMSSHEVPVVKGLEPRVGETPEDLLAGTPSKPSIVDMPKEVIAGPGSSPQLEAEVAGTPQPQLTWLKDGQPISDRDLRTGHVEIVDLPTDKPDTVKQALKINDLRPADVAAYSVKAENPLGEVESQPTEVKLDRKMSRSDAPKVAKQAIQEEEAPLDQVAPSILCDLPKEIVAGLGSSPQIVAEASGQPKPQLSWFIDGQLIREDQLAPGGHLELIDLPSQQPDSIKQALKINNLKPADVAAYHVKAENPLGECESQPTNLRIDRSMGPKDAPKVSGEESQAVPMEIEEQLAAPTDALAEQIAPQIVSQPQEVVAALGSSPKLEVELKAQPAAKVEWLKDGQPIPARLLRDGHLQLVEESSPVKGVIKQTLVVNDLRPSDVAAYTLKAENPLGQAESEPIKLKTDRSMSKSDEPKVVELRKEPSETVEPSEMVAPTIVSAPEEVVGGPGSSPQLVAEVAGKPAPEVSWFKDGQPLEEQPEFKSGHVEVIKLPTDQADVVKQALKINDMKPADVAAYHVKAENPAGQVESEPTNVRIDRSMAPSDEPIVTGVDRRPSQEADKAQRRPSTQAAPKILSAPEEVVAGRGGSPQIEALVSGTPQPQLTWLKDGQPLSDRDLRTGHLEVVDLPTERPDEVSQALKINDLRPTDVAAYSVKAENPLGAVESKPTSVRIDRSMAPSDEPVVSGVDRRPSQEAERAERRPSVEAAPKIISAPEEIVAGRGSSPQIETLVSGTPQPQLTWLKDGQPLSDRDLRTGHLEVVDLPAEKPDEVRQALKINDLKPTDVAAYSVKAENPLGVAESQPTKVKLDRKMSSSEQPVVKDAGVAPQLADETAQPPLDSTSFAPTIVSVPEEVVAGRGSSPLVEAVVAGRPAPKLSWFKDGQPIDTTQDNRLEVLTLGADEQQPDTIRQALKINDMRPSDVAAYHVRAENPLGQAESEPTNVRIDRKMSATEQPQVIGGGAKPDQQDELAGKKVERPRIAQLPRNIKAPLGSSPLLEVEVLGGPPDKVEWFKDGQPVEEKRDMHVELDQLPDGTQKLRINRMRPDDVGVYTVRATNAAGAAESGPITLSAAEAPDDRDERAAEFKPEILNTTEEVSAGPGSHPRLEVDVRAAPQAEVSWYKDGKPLSERRLSIGQRVTLSEERSPYAPDAVKYVLKVDRLKPTDAATYHLVAHNPLGVAESKPIQLKLDRALEADETPIVRKTIDDDDKAALARALGDDIMAAALGDQAAYAPQILSMTDEVVAGVGSSPKLVAVVKSNPLPSEVQWFKDGQPISQAELDSGHLEVARERQPDDETVCSETLQLNNMKPTDVAAYYVRVANPLGEADSEPANVRLDRSMKPSDEPLVSKQEQPFSPEEAELSRARPKSAPSIKRIPRTIVAPLGSSPVIEVEIEGEPKPEVVWLKDGRQVSDARGHLVITELPDGRTHRLSFTNLKAVDQGDFVVVATNEVGECQSGPISLVIDQTMGPKEQPRVIDSSEPEPVREEQSVPVRGFAPTIVRISDRVVGQLGGQAMVEVEVRASPQAVVSWILDGQQIPLRLFEEGHIKVETVTSTDDEDVVKYQLLIGALKPSDAGVYQLVAENPFGSVTSPSIGVTIRTSIDEGQMGGEPEEAKPKAPTRKLRAPTIKRAPKNVVAKEGSSPVLEVEVSGEPVPEIHWFRNGRRIERTDAHFSFEERPDEGVYRLVVNEVTKDDEAVYTVVATNEAGSAESAPIELSVEAKPKRAVEEPSEELVEPRRAQLETEAAPAPEPVTVPTRGFAPQILSSPEEIVSGAGSSPQLEVIIKASPQAQVEWFKDGQPIDLAVSPRDKLKYVTKQIRVDQETTKFVLEINNLKPTDVGAYHLRGENQFGCVETEPTNVRIDRSMEPSDVPQVASVEQPFDSSQPDYELPAEAVAAAVAAAAKPAAPSKPKKPIRAPTIKRMPRRVVAPLGSNPVIEVEISGEPKPEIVWFKNGKRLTEIKNKIVFEETPDGVFRVCFTDVKITDQAEYSFIAQNEAGNIESGPIELLVDRSLPRSGEPFFQEETELPLPTVVANEDGPIEAPRILELKDQEALPGQTVRLEAEVTGNPRPEIKWLKDGDEVELNVVNEVPDSNRHSLTLKNVNDLYDGVYSLEAKNVAGVARQDAKVKIVEKLSFVEPATLVEDQFKPEPAREPVKRKSLDEPKEKPFIKKGLKFSQVNQGRNIKFEVQIDGKYDELIWMKDGERINLPFEEEELEETTTEQDELVSTDHHLANNLDLDDDTSTLRASDDEADAIGIDGGLGEPKRLAGRKFPPRIVRRPRNVVAGPGSRIVFEVQYEGEPKPEIRWFKQDQLIETSQDGKVTIEQVGEDVVRLIIEDVQVDDVGSYFVLLENPYGSEKSQPVRLELDSAMPASDDLANCSTISADDLLITGGLAPVKRGRAPRILSRPRAVHAPKGSRVAFEVEVAGEPEPVVNWYRDGRIIKQSSDGRVIIEEYSRGCVRLVLSNITDQDVGLYHVVAENKLGSERTIPVSLTIDDSTSDGPVDLVGDQASVDSLDAEELRRRRGGRPPRILLRPSRLVAPLGGQAKLEVNVVGQSKPSIVWYKDGKRITAVSETTTATTTSTTKTTTTTTTRTSEERVRIERVSDNYERLVIDNLTSEDAGHYSVSAENDFGVSMSQPVELIVSSELERDEMKADGVTTTTTTTTTEETTTETTESFFERYVDDGSSTLHPGESPKLKRAPRFTIKPRNRRSPIGSKVDFEVKVSGEPKPDVVWYKNGRRIHTTADGRVRVEEFSDGGSKLIIEDLEETDHGVYAAEATNEWGKARTDDVQLRVTQRTEVSERSETKQRGGQRVTTRTKKTRSHYTFSEERHGYVTLTLNDAQLEHDGDYKLIVRNKWGEASTQAPLVVIPKVAPRAPRHDDRAASAFDDTSTSDGRDSRARRTPFDELEDYGHELNRQIGVFGSESRYQSGEDTYLLQLRDTEFPLRLRKYLRFGARQSPSLRSNLMDAHWGAGARVTIRERRKFREVMDEEIDDEKSGRDLRPTPMRLQKEVGTCGYAAAQLEHLRVEAAERVARQSAEGGPHEGGATEMMPPFFREKLKDCVIEEQSANQGLQEAVFFCLAAGEPKPDYTWFKNDVIITPDIHRMFITELPQGGSELRIRDPRLHDSGCYKCVARNVHGNVTSRARLRVASRPSRPEPPEYVSVTAREVFLQWRPPRDFDVNCADVLGYKLEMSQSSMGQDDHWTTIAADIGHEFYVVDDLTPGTSYSFRISARNKFGWSDTSYSAYVTTSRADSASGDAPQQRLVVPHEMRARQFVSEVCDSQTLRHCEDEKMTQLNYLIEQSPVKLNGLDGQERWQDAYSLQAEIARGRFSIISKGVAKQPQSSDNNNQQQEPAVKLVAMKFVPNSFNTSAQTKSEFDILRSLRHEKVVRLLMAYKDDDSFVFVMERLSGMDVLTYLSSFTQYNEHLVSLIIQQVMDAIEYLHFRGMCLLELQPDNVVMTNGRTASLKLVDFSSARFVPKSGARVPANASQNIEYCPPEVIANHEVSTASDVWCIGVLTYVLLSGFSPFKGDTEDETRENVRLGRYKYDHIYGNCTPEVTRFLINVFKKHSSKRPTIEQLYENKWLLPNEFMIRKRQLATFKTDKIVAFAEEFHKLKSNQESPENNVEKLNEFADLIGSR